MTVDMRGLRYFVVMSDDNITLAKDVSELLAQGWSLYGDVQVFTATDATGTVKIYLAQAVEKLP